VILLRPAATNAYPPSLVTCSTGVQIVLTDLGRLPAVKVIKICVHVAPTQQARSSLSTTRTSHQQTTSIVYEAEKPSPLQPRSGDAGWSRQPEPKILLI